MVPTVFIGSYMLQVPVISLVLQRWKKMIAAAAPRVLIFHSCAIFFFIFSRISLKFYAFFVQFWAFLLFLHNCEHFLHIFVCYFFRLEVLHVVFCKLFSSLVLNSILFLKKMDLGTH